MGRGLKPRKTIGKLPIGKRVVHSDRMLGVYGVGNFDLKKGEILEILEIDKYNRATVRLRDREFQILVTTVNNCSNEIKD